MFNTIIRFSLENKLIVLLGVLALVIMGVYSASRIPLDAVPDITNNQVQIVSVAPTYAPEEVEQLITYPLEAAMTNIPDVVEVRSISRYGLSVITIVFEEWVEVLRARQFVQEQLNVATGDLPRGVDTELMPITTGLGEIYQYVLTVDDAHAHEYDATRLRTIQDWIVKRQLNGTPGIIEVSSFGGYLKQYEVAIDPRLLRNYGVSLSQVLQSLEDNNENSGGSYLEQGSYSYYIRTEGRVNTEAEIAAIPLGDREGPPLRIGDVAQVRIGSAKRYGAMTMDGQGEVVGGITLMLKGANSSEALRNVEDRMKTIATALPEGVGIYPYLDRSRLIGRTIETVKDNLIEGGLIVIFVLLMLLGNLRAGLIVASVIPLSMLFALILMHYFGISANLMSLGAIDFGIVIDGAVIIVEGLLHTLALGYVGRELTREEMDGVVLTSTSRIYRSAAFGVLIILVVFLPILTLQGVEGKTFRPMAQVVSFAILGSLILSMTYVPVMSSLFLSRKIRPEKGIALKIMTFFERGYRPVGRKGLDYAGLTLGIAAVALVLSAFLFTRMGGEFIPTLEEGDIAMQQSIRPGSSLEESIATSTMAEKVLLDNFPEVDHVVSKIGTAEVPTDPMAIEDADIMIILKEKDQWKTADNTEDLMAKMKEKLDPISWASFEFTQPIQLRFNELMTGAKSDISVKLYGEDAAVLKERADRAAEMIRQIDGAGDVKVDQTDGLRQLNIRYDRDRLAQYGIPVTEANQLVRTAYAGEVVGRVYEGERSFDLVVRLARNFREELDLQQLSLRGANDRLVPLSEVAEVVENESPMLISRESARRFINIGVNVRNRDVASLVKDIQSRLTADLELPPGYEIRYGGQFENLQSARQRLFIAVPVALALIMLLLYLAFGSFRDALVIFVAVPLAAIGGVLALLLRGMPFSISSGIGFIALFGIAVLNGIVMISAIHQRDHKGETSLPEVILEAAISRLRPVLITAAVAAFGFLPMALSTGSGAEVQRPLATVVIGGLISSTLLTLIVLPALYLIVNRKKWRAGHAGAAVIALLAVGFAAPLHAQQPTEFAALYQYGLTHSPDLNSRVLDVRSEELNRRAIGVWAPLAVSYQGGQINTKVFDHDLNVQQNLNHFFNRRARTGVVDSRVEEFGAQLDDARNHLGYDLSQAFVDLRYETARINLLDSLLAVYTGLERNLETRRRAGTLGAIDEELFRQKVRELRRGRDLARATRLVAEGVVRRTAFLPDSLNLRPRPLGTAEPGLAPDSAGVTPYLRVLAAREQRLQREINLNQRLTGQPQLSLGYFHQSIEHQFGYQGVSVGVSIPLDARAGRARSEQLDLQRQQVSLERDRYTRDRNLRIQFLRESLDGLQSSLQENDAAAEAGRERILRIATLQFGQGAISFLTYSQLIESLLTERQNRLEQLRTYYRLLAELRFLTNTPN